MRKWFLAAVVLALCSTTAFAQLGGGIFGPSSKARDVLFANLSTPVDGNFRYCTDCAATAPCTGSGTGAFAYRAAGAWNCSTGAAGASNPFSDASALVKDNVDDTKLVRIDAGGITTGNTTVLTMSGTAAAPILSLSGGRVEAGGGALSTPSFFVNNGSVTGWYSSSANNFDIGVNNVHAAEINSTGIITRSTNKFAWTSTGDSLQANIDTALARTAAGVVELNSGTNGQLRDLEVRGLRVNQEIEGSTSKTLTDASATAFVDISVAQSSYVGGIIQYTITATNATPDFQARSGAVPFAAVNKAGTETCTVDTADADEVVAVSAGTLTNSFTCTVGLTDVIRLNATADSSLTTPTVTLQYRVVITSGTATVTPQ